jgi:SAF domain
MASTTLPPRTGAPGDRAAPTLVPGRGRQRRWSLALVAVLMTLGSALAFVVLWMNAGDRKPVLALRNDVVAGQPIGADDLTVVRVSADAGVPLVSSSARDDVIGEPAAVNLLAGTILTPNAIRPDAGLETGTAVIALPVPRSELPANDLDTGDHVTIYRTAAQGDDSAGEAAEVLGEGQVFSVGDDDDGSNVRVSVTVDELDAAEIANAVQADRFYLAKTSAE